MSRAHHRAYVTTLGRDKVQRRLQLAVLLAMEAGTPLVAGQLGEKRVHSATLAALVSKGLVEVNALNRVYRLTEADREVVEEYRSAA